MLENVSELRVFLVLLQTCGMCVCERFLQDPQKDRNIQCLPYRPSCPAKVSLTRELSMLRAIAPLMSKSLCPVGN